MRDPNIIYEDGDALVIDKPSGLASHGDGKRSMSSVADWVSERYPDLMHVGEPLVLATGEVIARPGIVHRLDKETSGVMLIAKTQEAFVHFKEQFQNRNAEKTYHAFAYGKVSEDKGTIDFPIGRSRKDFRLRSAQPKAKGDLREAITKYIVLMRGPAHTFLELHPKTGRMHQIRVHLKAIHHPVVCDALYAPNHPHDLGFNRLALHASALTIALPDGATKTFTAPLPEEFEQAKKRLPEG